MHRIAAALLALSVTQAEPAAPVAPAATPSAPAEPAPAPAPPPAPAAPAEPTQAAERPAPPEPRPSPAQPRPRPPPAVPAAPASPPAASRPPAPPPAPLPPKPAAELPPAAPRPEREAVLAVALRFLDALLDDDAAALAAESAIRFSFDGDVVEGRSAQAARWRELLSRRGSSPAALRDLVLLDDADAVARLGPPPARIAPLVRPGAWIAVADVSTRPVILVLVREGSRFVVAGVHG